MNLALHATNDADGFTEIYLSMPRRMHQGDEHLLCPLTPASHVILHNRNAAREAVFVPKTLETPPDPVLTKAIACAHAWRARLTPGEAQSVADLAKAERVTEAHIRQRLRLAFLAPDVTVAILDGRQPPGLTLEQILNSDFPLHWQGQRRLFGFDGTG